MTGWERWHCSRSDTSSRGRSREHSDRGWCSRSEAGWGSSCWCSRSSPARHESSPGRRESSPHLRELREESSELRGEALVDGAHRTRALPNSGCHPLHRVVADIAGSEDPGDGCLEWQASTGARGEGVGQLAVGEDEAILTEEHLRAEPGGGGTGPDEAEEPRAGDRLRIARRGVLKGGELQVL